MPAYRAFGLSIDSEIDFGSASALRQNSGEDQHPPDVIVRWGETDAANALLPFDGDGWFEFAGDVHRFGWPEVGTVEITAGTRVRVWPIRGVAKGLVEHVLFGPVMADILLSRGQLPLHASASRIGDKVVAFVGQSGMGKSTLVAAMHEMGFEAHGDDLIGVQLDGPAMVHFGINRIKLNADSARAVGTDPDALKPVYFGTDKRVKPIKSPETGDPRRLAAVYRLVDADRLDIVPVDPKRATMELLVNCFRVEVQQHACGVPVLLRHCAAIAERVPLFRLQRPKDLSRLKALVSTVGEHAGRLG